MPEPDVREREALAAEVQSLTARLEACESALTTAHENWAADRDALAWVAALAEELRERLDGAILAKLRESNPLYYEDAADELTDALLPLVVAYGRERAAAALAEAAEKLRYVPLSERGGELSDYTAGLHAAAGIVRARAAALKGSEEGT